MEREREECWWREGHLPYKKRPLNCNLLVFLFFINFTTGRNAFVPERRVDSTGFLLSVRECQSIFGQWCKSSPSPPVNCQYSTCCIIDWKSSHFSLFLLSLFSLPGNKEERRKIEEEHEKCLSVWSKSSFWKSFGKRPFIDTSFHLFLGSFPPFFSVSSVHCPFCLMSSHATRKSLFYRVMSELHTLVQICPVSYRWTRRCSFSCRSHIHHNCIRIMGGRNSGQSSLSCYLWQHNILYLTAHYLYSITHRKR